jgi:serine/threonine protein phosphatase PrpC
VTVLKGGAATDVGRVRQINEDRFLVTEGLFAVADGVGGHQAGEVAAQTSVEALAKAFTERTTEGLVSAIQEANKAVWRLAQSHAEKRGMGTTLTVLALVQEEGEDQLAVANVGDSRAYLFQRNELVQVSEDHSLVEELVREGQLTPQEAQVHPQRSIITRALGMESEIKVDAWNLIPYAGDRIVLCSDGLTNEVSDDRIASTLRQLSDPKDAANELVRQARAHGGNDNITVVVVNIVDDGGRAERASAALAASDTGSATRTSKAPTLPSAPTPTPKSTKTTDETAEWTRMAAGGGKSTGSSGGGTRVGDPVRGGGGGGAGDRGGGGTRSVATATRAEPVVRSSAKAKARPQKPRRLTWRVAVFVVLVLAVLAVSFGSVAWYARSAYYVGLAGDQVAIFKGRPGGILWFEPTLVERKPLRVEDILPAKIDELRAGKQEPSKADADRYVNNLRQEAAERRAGTTTTTAPAPPPGGNQP